MHQSRRDFVKNSALYSLGLNLGTGPDHTSASNDLNEPARSLVIAGEADVIVAGGGPAGIAAAIAAARSGASVQLFDVNGCLGGVWTAGILAWVFEFNKPGLTRELTYTLDKRGARQGTDPDKYVYDIEEMKLLLEEKCVEANVKFQLHTRVVAAYKDKQNRLTSIVTESKSGRQAWRGKIFIDATGDGDLGALAGCKYEYGWNNSGLAQPMTYMALVSVKNADSLKEYISFWEGDLSWRTKAWQGFLKEINRAGITPSYGKPTLFRVKDNLLALMINHEYNYTGFNSEHVTRATVGGRAEVNKITKALNKMGGVWDGIQLVATCEQIGVREGRRISGLYTISKEDIAKGAKFTDAVTHVTFGVDIHAPSPEENQKSANSDWGVKSVPYDIPLRALIAKDVNGLLMAGRCISGDFFAHSSYRVTGCAVSTGQAVGITAALCAARGTLPQNMPWESVQSSLGNFNQQIASKLK
jgi:hypothetical protein